jgi:hypothetical protein
LHFQPEVFRPAGIHFDWRVLEMNIKVLSTTLCLCLISHVNCDGQSVLPRKTALHVESKKLVDFPGAWAFQFGQAGIILVRDEELETLAADPDRKIDLSTTKTPRIESLREICEGQSSVAKIRSASHSTSSSLSIGMVSRLRDA